MENGFKLWYNYVNVNSICGYKSFEINGKNKAIQSVIVEIENENVSISTHKRDINNVVNKIKKPEQLIYTSEEVGLKIERITGKQLVTVNQTRVNDIIESPLENIPQTNENSRTNKPSSNENDSYALPEDQICFIFLQLRNLLPEIKLKSSITEI